MNLLKLIRKGESKTLELKENLPSAVNLAKTVIAFSNTGGGKLVIGVNDKREIAGIKENKVFDLQEKVSSIIYDMCYPNILPEIYTVNIDGKILLVIEIFRGSLLPYYLKKKGKLKGTYIRVGSTNRFADKSMILELERQRIGRSFDEEENFEYEIAKLNLQPIFREFKKIRKEADIVKLKNLRLIKFVQNKDVPTNALLIILGLLDNTGIKCARFKGSTMEYFIDKKEFTGVLFSNLENIMAFLKNHLNLKAEIKGLQREERYEIPLVAIREVILNAIIHRDYTRNSDIKVAVYDDIVEIVSPGGLPNGLTVEEVFNGRSELRNKVLARLFKELGYVETWGSGLKRIKQICREEKVLFEFKETGNFVSVVFKRRVTNKKVLEKSQKTSEKPAKNQRKTSGKPANITLQEERVLELFKVKDRIKLSDVEKLFNVKSARAREILSKMVKKRLINKIGKTKGTYYVINLPSRQAIRKLE